jgi:hypothetical protein
MELRKSISFAPWTGTAGDRNGYVCLSDHSGERLMQLCRQNGYVRTFGKEKPLSYGSTLNLRLQGSAEQLRCSLRREVA